MSNFRQPDDPNHRSNHRQQHLEEPSLVRAASVGFSTGYHWRLHGSDWGVLVWASRGVISVTVDQRLWVVPPNQALWVPPRLSHAVHMAGRGTLRQVYVTPSRCDLLPGAPQVWTVTSLLRELLRRVCDLGTLQPDQPAERRLFELLLDELAAEHTPPLELPMPRDSRAVRAAEYTREAPADAQSPERAARAAHTSVRTLERLFKTETGLSFGAWRQRARLMRAMTLLADGASVTAVGFTVGYANTSAFVAAFRRHMGTTPGRYSVAAAD